MHKADYSENARVMWCEGLTIEWQKWRFRLILISIILIVVGIIIQSLELLLVGAIILVALIVLYAFRAHRPLPVADMPPPYER
jgi:hypothetical protein